MKTSAQLLGAIVAGILLVGCGAPAPTGVKVIVGAQLARPGQPDIQNSVVVIADGKIREAGPQSDVPVPKGSEITSGLGKVIEGRVEPGQPADLVLRDAQTKAIEKTMAQGEWTK